jgi:imidazolonepropionase-like amidohydrolase
MAALRYLAATGVALALGGAAFAQKTAIVDATVFDGTGAAPYVATVVIDGATIESVEKGGKAPRGATVVRGKGLALLPGLHDLHTHYFSRDRGRYNPSEVNWSYVSSGVTAVGDFSQAAEAYAPRRAWFATMPGPHVLVAGRIAPYNVQIADWGDPDSSTWVDTPYGATRGVKALAAYKPDIVKVFTDGWRYGTGAENASMDLETLSALVAEAKAQNLPVLSHTVTIDRGKIAAKAGVSVIAHALQDRAVDQELLDLMVKNGVAHAPTLATYEPIKPGQVNFTPNDPGLKARLARFDLALANVKAMHDAGVPIVIGSDSGNRQVPHGPSSLHEMELLVKAGLTPSEALVAATANSARASGHAERGVIAPGKAADLVLIDGKPWETIADVRKTVRTFVDGKTVFRKGAKPPSRAEQPPPVPAKAVLADFESADGRMAGGALPTADLDRDGLRSVQVLSVVPRGAGHALAAASRMADRADAFTEIVLPLNTGGVAPADLRAYRGLSFELQGEGDYDIALMTPAGRWTGRVTAGEDWGAHKVAFADLKAPSDDAAWSGVDVTAIRLRIVRAAGTSLITEIDNVGFY